MGICSQAKHSHTFTESHQHQQRSVRRDSNCKIEAHRESHKSVFVSELMVSGNATTLLVTFIYKINICMCICRKGTFQHIREKVLPYKRREEAERARERTKKSSRIICYRSIYILTMRKWIYFYSLVRSFTHFKIQW